MRKNWDRERERQGVENSLSQNPLHSFVSDAAVGRGCLRWDGKSNPWRRIGVETPSFWQPWRSERRAPPFGHRRCSVSTATKSCSGGLRFELQYPFSVVRP
ncbi:hypothetical protein CEXT_593071 [Caerostris extrusa]|uniref:Uncharacterized protein n=1 Tax=Caerostris extrusa TaxID=172846 RepID=A0AAV4QIR4_CAEEX|nr:hypothetical protein CEXT_593071 [Caerostris extrusa]